MNKFHQEEIPAHIYDWINQYSFEQLTPDRQAEVLQHLSQEAYDELYDVNLHLKQVSAIPAAPGRESRKALLLDAFDRKHNTTSRRITFTPLAWWRAAAILLFISTGCLGYYAMNHQRTLNSVVATTIDTLYITKEIAVAPVKIIDTIFIERPSAGSQHNSIYASVNRQKHAADMEEEQAQQPGTSRKGNSMKDDTLNKIFSFVSL